MISASAMAVILARGRRRNRLGQPRIESEDLPAPLAKSLAYSVAAALRLHAPGLGAKEGHPSFGNAATAFLQARDENKAVDRLTSGLVRTLNQSRLLDERLLEHAADEGDVAFLAARARRARGYRRREAPGIISPTATTAGSCCFSGLPA